MSWTKNLITVKNEKCKAEIYLFIYLLGYQQLSTTPLPPNIFQANT